MEVFMEKNCVISGWDAMNLCYNTTRFPENIIHKKPVFDGRYFFTMLCICSTLTKMINFI